MKELEAKTGKKVVSGLNAKSTLPNKQLENKSTGTKKKK
jgi:hypothetical protein